MEKKSRHPNNSLKEPLLFILIVGIATVLILALLFGIPLGIHYFKSKSQCGNGGLLIGNSDKGYYCGYQYACEECKDSSQCQDCSELCKSKGKTKREGYCGPNKIEFSSDKLKKDVNGNIYIEDPPVHCYCCCD